MTSNLGSHLIQESFENVDDFDYEKAAEKAKFKVLELLKQTIRPEFLNRIDETIMFTPLSKNHLRGIVEIQLNNLKALLAEKDIQMHITADAFDWICTAGYDPQFGARPVKRVIQKQVLNELSKALLSKTIDVSSVVVMDVFDSKIVFRKPINELEEIV
jgi:ATP-dependent Clp protease ATP-binding subunit ClpB